MTQMQTYATYALAGTGVFLLVLWFVMRSRSRKRREVRAEIERKLAAETKAEQDRAAKDHMDHVFGRRTMYRREMAQRELDRYYGNLAAGTPDPSFEDWAAAKGLTIQDEVDEVGAG